MLPEAASAGQRIPDWRQIFQVWINLINDQARQAEFPLALFLWKEYMGKDQLSASLRDISTEQNTQTNRMLCQTKIRRQTWGCHFRSTIQRDKLVFTPKNLQKNVLWLLDLPCTVLSSPQCLRPLVSLFQEANSYYRILQCYLPWQCPFSGLYFDMRRVWRPLTERGNDPINRSSEKFSASTHAVYLGKGKKWEKILHAFYTCL